MGQNVGWNLIGPLKSGIIADNEDYGDTMSYMDQEAKDSLLSVVEDHSPPSSPLSPDQEQQEVVEENEGEEKIVALGVRLYVFEPLAPDNSRRYYWLNLPWVLPDSPRPAGKCTLVSQEALPFSLLPDCHARHRTSLKPGT